jgi:Leucine-rich repeat (LRR) protein
LPLQGNRDLASEKARWRLVDVARLANITNYTFAMTEASNSKPDSHPKRRWLRFSLRSLLLAMTVFGVWLGVKVNAARQQREIVRMVHELGGIVWYDYEFDSAGNHLNPPPEPGWLANFIGVDFLHNVLAVRVLNENYQRPNNYSALMARLPEVPQLRFLVLTAGKLRDEDFQHLAGLSRLEYVALIANDITGQGAQFLKHASRLKMLFSTNNVVSDQGLDAIAALPNLQWLRLLSSGLTDARLDRIRPLTNLEKLELSDTTITDASIDTLLSFPRLKDINLWQTAITPDGVKRLQQARPSLKIVYH